MESECIKMFLYALFLGCRHNGIKDKRSSAAMILLSRPSLICPPGNNLLNICQRKILFQSHWLIRQTEHISYGLKGNFPFNDVQSLIQRKVFHASLSPSFVCQPQSITKRSVRKSGRRGVRNCSGNISDSIMNNAIYCINRVAMGCRMRCFKTSSLIYGDINQNRSWLHEL